VEQDSEEDSEDDVSCYWKQGALKHVDRMQAEIDLPDNMSDHDAFAEWLKNSGLELDHAPNEDQLTYLNLIWSEETGVTEEGNLGFQGYLCFLDRDLTQVDDKLIGGLQELESGFSHLEMCQEANDINNKMKQGSFDLNTWLDEIKDSDENSKDSEAEAEAEAEAKAKAVKHPCCDDIDEYAWFKKGKTKEELEYNEVNFHHNTIYERLPRYYLTNEIIDEQIPHPASINEEGEIVPFDDIIVTWDVVMNFDFYDRTEHLGKYQHFFHEAEAEAAAVRVKAEAEAELCPCDFCEGKPVGTDEFPYKGCIKEVEKDSEEEAKIIKRLEDVLMDKLNLKPLEVQFLPLSDILETMSDTDEIINYVRENFLTKSGKFSPYLICDENSKDSEETSQELPDNMSGHGAFAEWFDKNIKSVEDCEKEGLCFVDVMKEWCKENNHEWTSQGVINGNVMDESSKDSEDSEDSEEDGPDCCMFCDKRFDFQWTINKNPKLYNWYLFEGHDVDEGDLCFDCCEKHYNEWKKTNCPDI